MDTYKEKQKQNTSNGHKILRITERITMNKLTFGGKVEIKNLLEKKSEITEMVWMRKKNIFMANIDSYTFWRGDILRKSL